MSATDITWRAVFGRRWVVTTPSTLPEPKTMRYCGVCDDCRISAVLSAIRAMVEAFEQKKETPT